MKLLAFSDLHRDVEQATLLVEAARAADVVIAAGDFVSIHKGLEETIEALRPIDEPTRCNASSASSAVDVGTVGTRQDTSTPAGCRLGAERSSVQIRRPDFAEECLI